MGLLANCEDNWEKRISIVEAMRGIDTKPCADPGLPHQNSDVR